MKTVSPPSLSVDGASADATLLSVFGASADATLLSVFGASADASLRPALSGAGPRKG
jgi:hypothetical protein